ncbi:hypothetical protein P153DRAFT_408707, partial [Dothidotthia symphoricarpi CBS 119687]
AVFGHVKFGYAKFGSSTIPFRHYIDHTVGENEQITTILLVQQQDPLFCKGHSDSHYTESTKRLPSTKFLLRTANMHTIQTTDTLALDNQEYLDLDFFEYNNESILILCSFMIQHNSQPSNKPSWALQEEALALQARGFRAYDMGRRVTFRNGPVKAIDDVDLYLFNSKIHVATERGLLLVADYLKLLGIPDTQPVRFDGETPAWAQNFVPPSPNLKRDLISGPEEAELPPSKKLAINQATTRALVVSITTDSTTSLENMTSLSAAASTHGCTTTGLLTPPLERLTDWPLEDEVDWSDSELD